MKTLKIHYALLHGLMLIGLFNTVMGQSTVTIGNGTSAQTYSPVYTFDKYSTGEILYLGTEIATTGNITSIGFEKTAGVTTAIPNVTIYMKTVSNTVVGTTSTLSGYIQVWSGSFPNTASGWQTVTLATPFAFTSTSDNLSIVVVNNSSTSLDAPKPTWSYTTTGTNYRASYWYGSTNSWTSSTTMSKIYNRPNIRVTVTPASPCSGTPVPGNTVTTAGSVCAGTAFTLSLQNSTAGSGVTYQWQSSPNGTTGWGNITGAISSSLSTSQTAAAYYRCNLTCSGSTGTSAPVQVSLSNTIPFLEGFESGSTNGAIVGGCWQQQSISGSATWIAGNNVTTNNRAPRTGSWNASLTYSNEDWLFYALPLTGGVAYDLEFYTRQDTDSGVMVTAAYGTSATAAAMANTVVASTAVVSGNYQKLNGTFTPVTTGTYYIGIKATVAFSPYYVSIDDIKVAVATGCIVANGVTAGNVTATSATLSWTAPATAPASGYEYYRTTNGTAPTAATTPAGTTAAGVSTATLSGLAANTLYYVWVRSVCSANDKSAWTGSTFTTACDAVNAPYTQNFDSASTLPGCTTVQNVNADSATWGVQTSSTYASSGTNSLRYATGTTAANDWWFTPGINVTAGTTYKITFKYRAFSSTYPEALEVKSGTTQNAAGMAGVALFSNNNITSALYNTATVYYTATTNGVQYFGWHALTTASGFYLCIDDIAITALPDCSTATLPSAVTGQASKTSVCSSEVLTFSLVTAMPEATGFTYQWKSSADGVNYTNIGIASATSTASLTADENNRYFKCGVVCNGSVVLTSAPLQIGVNVSIFTTTAGSRCGQGTVQLGAATQSGNSIKWYASADSTTALGTGSTFTTPTIAHTTNFYAGATGQQTISAAGANNPAVVGDLGSSNNAVETYFSVASATSLTSVTIYPLDPGTNNKIILKNSSGTVLQEYTFTITAAEANSQTSTMSSPKVVTLNWTLPAGSYKLQWDNPGGATANRVLRNLSGAASYYNTNYSGVTFTGNSGSGTGYWFYFYDWKFTTGCGESAIRVPVTATVTYEWTGAADTNWNNPLNWCGNTVPGIEDAVKIPAASATLIDNNSVAYTKSLAVEGNTNVTVKPGSTLWIANALTVAANASLTVENNAALVQVNTATNTGAVAVQKRANPLFRLDYTLWSAPVTGQTLRTFSMGTSNNRFYVYDYANNGVEFDEGYWPVDPISTYFTPGKGYLIRMPNSVPSLTGYADGTASYAFEGTFIGVPNNGNYNPVLSQLGNRYTAVGNPYPSPISLAAFLSANTTRLAADTGIWFWRKKNGSGSSYVTLNLSGLAVDPDNGSSLDEDLSAFYANASQNGSWLIAPGQGFIVQAKAGLAEPALSFTNSMRRATPGAQAFFRQAAGTASRYWLNINAENGSGSQALVAYMEEATPGLDYGYDSKTFTNGISLYSLAAENKLTIQARPEFEVIDVVPMGFTAPTTGTYTISIDHTDGLFANGQTIYLKDVQESVIRNLSLNDYTFTTEAGTFEGRFEMHYQTSALNTDVPILDANSVVVFKQGNTININAGSAMINSVKVFDVCGRQLYAQNSISATEISISNLVVQREVLIVEVATDKGTVSKRIVFLNQK